MKKYTIFASAILVSLSFGSVAYANHSWGNYHWARTTNPFALQLGDAVTGVWDTHLATASQDWSISSVLDTRVVASAANPKTCKPVLGRVEVCNSKYGNTSWLGIAQVWVSGGEHITQGTVKLNDTYFTTAKYNKPEWRNLVLCQEVGHTFGLDHQDEIFENANLNTCMDYTNNPLSNQHPNQHDYDQLTAIYQHLDTTTTVKTTTAALSVRELPVSERSEWGKEVKKDSKGNSSVFKRDLGHGEEVFTFVVWAD